MDCLEHAVVNAMEKKIIFTEWQENEIKKL